MKPPRRMRRMRALDRTEFDELLDGRFRRRVGPLEHHPEPQDVVEIERVHGHLVEAVIDARHPAHYCPGRCGASVPLAKTTKFICRSCWTRLPLDIRTAIDAARPNPLLLTDLTRGLRDARIWFAANPLTEEARRG